MSQWWSLQMLASISFGLDRPSTFADITVSAGLEKGLLDPLETSE